jgi:hypothetical protein
VGKPAVPRKLKAARERDFVSGFTSKAETGDYVNKCEQMQCQPRSLGSFCINSS